MTFLHHPLLLFLSSSLLLFPRTLHSFSPSIRLTRQRQRIVSSQLHVKNKQDEKQLLEQDEDAKPIDEVYGAKFFGGNAQKEELYDPVVEAEADKVFKEKRRDFFPKMELTEDPKGRELLMRLQREICAVLREEEEEDGKERSCYAANVKWNGPFRDGGSEDHPLKELRKAAEFYNRVDVSLLAAETLSDDNTLRIRWEMSLTWPNVWESKVLLTGTSLVTLSSSSENDDVTITSQTDTLDHPDLLLNLARQLTPRFWDLYHIGMTPSAELLPKLPSTKKKGLFARYDLFELPPRLVVKPSLIDTGGRIERQAQALPNHAFGTIIKTMGPKKQRYTPVNPIEVSIRRNVASKNSIITWTVGVPPEVSCQLELPLPVEDEESDPETESFRYEYQPRRRIATLKFGGCPQDEEVTKVRKELYEAIITDGFKPKEDGEGKPVFLFFQNEAKACFVPEGLGMAVYDWRSKLARGNEVGIELEVN